VTVLLQGVLGGITVLIELHPLIVMGHFLLSLLALAVAVVVVTGADHFLHAAEPRPPLAANWLALVLVPSAFALVITGTLVTAAGPHSGGEKIRRFGLLPDALHLHVGAAALFGIAYLGAVASLYFAQPRPRMELLLAGGLLVALLVQMVIGDIQWRTHLPWGLVLVHVALATAVWAGVVALAARLILRSKPRLP
jgi:heme a synthase